MRIVGDWLAAPATQAVCAALTARGNRALFVGGCVRNALLGRPVADIDIATDAVPETTIALARAAGLHPVPTGIEHGTITIVAGRRPYEVTTFRRDIETTGRHAIVAFTSEVAEDARRRDFTMNALYADPAGNLVDPLGGLPDLLARRVRFVGDPAERIAEDYLRILRFFRIHAWYGDPAGGLDPDGLAACAELQDGLERLSRERVGAEICKLLGADDPAPSVAAMAATGILTRILPGADPTGLAPLVHVEKVAGVRPDWRRRLAVLGGDPAWPGALRLSRADARAVAAIRSALCDGLRPAASAWRHGADAGRDAALITASATGGTVPDDLATELARGASARLPLAARDLGLEGPALGAALRRAEAAWIAADLRLDDAALRAAAAGGTPA
jgi:poly(A) polymerase